MLSHLRRLAGRKPRWRMPLHAWLWTRVDWRWRALRLSGMEQFLRRVHLAYYRRLTGYRELSMKSFPTDGTVSVLRFGSRNFPAHSFCVTPPSASAIHILAIRDHNAQCVEILQSAFAPVAETLTEDLQTLSAKLLECLPAPVEPERQAPRKRKWGNGPRQRWAHVDPRKHGGRR